MGILEVMECGSWFWNCKYDDLSLYTSFHSLPTYLDKKGYAPTTIKNMLNSVTLFVKHIKNSFLSVSKIRSKDINKLVYEIKRLTSDVQRKVLVHRQKVLRKKTGKQCPCLSVWQYILSKKMHFIQYRPKVWTHLKFLQLSRLTDLHFVKY